MTIIATNFKLSTEEKFSDLIPESDNLIELIRTFANRVFHYFRTFEWINEEACLKECFEAQIEATIENQRKIQDLYGKIVAQKYPEYKALGGKMESEETSNHSWDFFVRFIQDPLTIGSIIPSSNSLAEKVTRKIPDFDAHSKIFAQRYLEIGPGTGPMTAAIVRKLRANDSLDLVEFDPSMCEILKKRFGHLPNVRIIQGSILDFELEEGFAKYDATISGLPLTAFSLGQVEAVLKKYDELTVSGGWITYYDYIAQGKIKEIFTKLFLSQEKYDNIRSILDLKKQFTEKHPEKEKDTVLWNIGPAYARHYRVPSPYNLNSSPK